MKAKTLGWVVLVAAVLGGAGGVQGEAVRGEITGWVSAPWMATDGAFSGDTHYSVTLTGTTARTSGFKFDQSGDWANQWGLGESARVNSSIGRATKNGEDLSFSELLGRRYTFRLTGTADWSDRSYVIMATTNNPVTITSVKDNSATVGTGAVTVTAQLSAATSGEGVYVRWTTNGFTNSALSVASVAGTAATIAIPGQPSGRTVKYYVLTSTMPTNILKVNYDLCTLRANTAGGTNFSYLVGEAEPVFGNCWHFPTNAEPVGATMRNPTNPSPSADTYVYVGNYQTDADMSGGTVFYRNSTNATWSATNLSYDSASGDNNYWVTAIPSNAVALGETLQYYLQVTYTTGAATTYLGTSDQADNVKYATASNAAALPFAVTSAANLGNAWHHPAHAEPAGVTMRNPRHPYADQAVTLYTGNQDGGTEGNPGDQSGGTLYYRLQGAGGWSTLSLSYDSASGDNKYWRGTIPASTFAKAQTVHYVLAATYTDHDTTYLGAKVGGAESETFATLAAAQAQPFDFIFGGDAGTEPGYVWHGGNAVKLAGDTVQIWVKIGYKDGANAWADHAEVRYKVGTATTGSKKQGVRAVRSGTRAVDPTLTKVVAMTFDHEEEDPSANGNAMWWVATVVDPDLAGSADAALMYQIAAWKSAASGGNGVERLAEYQVDDTIDQFEYRMQGAGANALCVNGVNADYTTTKFFIDEATNETAHLRAEYVPPTGATDVQIFSNVGRRDYWDADVDSDGVPDAIRPPSGDWVTTVTEGYYKAYDMTWYSQAGAYVWEADIGQCGAYRLTARYKTDGDTNWHYYSEAGSGIRDHAVVISPRKVLQQSIYELNALSVKATAPTENGRSTFADLIGTRETGQGTFDEFGIEYLNKIQANCLWFQPIHTSSEYGLGAGGEPGSPYSAKDYFAVSKWFGRDTTTASALNEFQQFVAACDAGKSAHMATSYVGTINIMLDGVFNHTSWDAVFGEMGEQMGLVSAGQGATTAIGRLRPGWFANYSDYGAPATFYNGPAGGQHDIASAPDRGDFGKWLDTAELFFGNYAALVRHNPDNNSDYLNEADWYDYSSMTAHTEELWAYMGAYPEFWLEKTGHSLSNQPGRRDANGILVDDYGIDGLRCDFGQGLPPQFWEYIINRTRATKWNFMFMAESLDGGKVSYRSNRHFDILNESFVFQMVGANSPSDVKNAIESRKSMYAGGAVLLNLTSHDEVMPYSDPWTTASRFAMVSSVMGLPMTFYGQEQGIVPCQADKSGKNPGDSVAGDASSGFATFELNMGKWVPHFKNWNKLLIWDSPPNAGWSRPMAQWYGRVNWARLNSPALQSSQQYFLGRKGEGTYDNGKIFAVAKVEESGAVASGHDAVLAFALFVNEGDHSGSSDTYDLTGCWDSMGLINSLTNYYNVRNLAASDAAAAVWGTPKTGAELYTSGIYVSFDSDDTGTIYDDGHIVQYLKIEEAPTPGTATSNSPAAVPYAWLDGYYPGGHSGPEYEALAMQFASNGVMTVWQTYVAGLDPTDADALFEMGSEFSTDGARIVVDAATGRAYRIEFLDGTLATSPQTWSAFQANGVWTNIEPYTSQHVFFDDGTVTNSGSPIQTQRNYRIWVGMP